MSNSFVMGSNLGASLVAEQKLATELPTLLPNLTVLVDGVTMTGAAVVADVEQHIAAEQQILAVKEQLKELQSRIKPVRAKVRAEAQAVKTAATVAFGSDSQSYQKLGFTSPKLRKVASAATKAEGIVKGAATREARGTKGSRQKAAIHGTVPATTPTAPAPAPTPATPATPAVK
jgi:hypothetical protein